MAFTEFASRKQEMVIRLQQKRWMLAVQPAWLALLSGLIALPVVAQEQGSSPYYLGATQSFTRDSNILRREDALRDTVSTTGLRAGLDQNFGRQRALVELDVSRSRYNQYTQYNYTGYGVKGRLDWETIERISGTLSANADRSLYRSTTYTGTERNLQTNRGVALQAVVGTVTRWSIDGALSTNRSTYSVTTQFDLRQSGFGLGLRYRPSEALSLRTGVRRTKGSYIGRGQDFTRDDIDFDSRIELTGASRLTTRFSATRTDYELATTRDFKGWTGSLGWNWRPTGKLQFDLTASRDNSLGSVNQFAQLVNDYAGDTRVTNSLGLRTAYELTSKVGLNGGLTYSRRTLDNTFLDAGTTGFVLGSGKDNTKTVSLGVRYVPLRNVDLGCNFNWEDRNVSASGQSRISFPYTARSFGCSGQIYLR